MPSAAPPRYGFVIDNRRCIGCHACTVACKAEHDDPIGVNKTWVSYIEKGVYPDVARAFHVMRCNHCAEAPCVEICPTACLETRPDGIVDFDPGRCIGCKACMQACPYDAITIHPDHGTATKCNYCSHRTDEGRAPACVVVCPAEAIIAGDLANPTSPIARLVAGQDVSVRKPEKGTVPKLYYIDGDAAALRPDGAAPQRATLWGEKPADGVAATHGAPWGTPRGAPRRAYDIAQRHAGSWGWRVSAYLFTKSVAAGAFLVPAMAALAGLVPVADAARLIAPWGLVGALAGLALTGVLLVADLKRPERFLWVLLRPQWRSWLVRGAYIIAAYSILLIGWWLLRPAPDGVWAILGALLAAGTACYSGWLFGQAKGRDLWQSPLVPIHLLVQAVVAGLAFHALWAPDAWLLVALGWAVAVSAALVGAELWGRHATTDASAAAHSMRRGARGAWLWIGCLGVGHALALGLAAGGQGALAGLCALAGVAIYEHLWVEAPQRIALA